MDDNLYKGLKDEMLVADLSYILTKMGAKPGTGIDVNIFYPVRQFMVDRNWVKGEKSKRYFDNGPDGYVSKSK